MLNILSNRCFTVRLAAPIVHSQIFKCRERVLSRAVGGESLYSKNNFSDKGMQVARLVGSVLQQFFTCHRPLPPPARASAQILKNGTNSTAFASQSLSPYGCHFHRLETPAVSLCDHEFVMMETLIRAAELIDMITVKWIHFGTTLNCARIHVLPHVSWEIRTFSNMSGFRWSLGATNLLLISLYNC